jgi:hypothetical protein
MNLKTGGPFELKNQPSGGPFLVETGTHPSVANGESNGRFGEESGYSGPGVARGGLSWACLL